MWSRSWMPARRRASTTSVSCRRPIWPAPRRTSSVRAARRHWWLGLVGLLAVSGEARADDGPGAAVTVASVVALNGAPHCPVTALVAHLPLVSDADARAAR